MPYSMNMSTRKLETYGYMYRHNAPIDRALYVKVSLVQRKAIAGDVVVLAEEAAKRPATLDTYAVRFVSDNIMAPHKHMCLLSGGKSVYEDGYICVIIEEPAPPLQLVKGEDSLET